VAKYIRLIRRFELSGLELFDYFPNRAGAANDHAYAGRRQGLMRVRAAVPGQNVLDAFVCHEPGRLNPGSLAELLVGVVNRLEAHVVSLNDEETRAAAEPWIDIRIQRR